jgi:hypothetical protein
MMRRRALMARPALAGLVGLALVSGCAENLPAPAWQLDGEETQNQPSYAFAGAIEIAPAAPAPPLSLTASDGTGLRLAELEAHAVVEEPLAFTELHLVFDNPDDRRLEGTFTITLPEGAALSRFAMKIGSEWQEGEVVEKGRARAAYEDFLHRRQDPALLEQAPGNQFSARVFPIQPRARKELIVSYSQELAGGRPYVLPLHGLPKLGRLAISVSLAGQGRALDESEQSDVKPAADYTLDAKRLGGGAGLRSGELVLARVRPIPAADPDPFGPTLLLVDTSASRALGFEEEVRLVGRLVRRIAETAGASTRIAVGAFDQTTDTIFEGEAGSFAESDLRRLHSRQAFGASSLGAAIVWAEARAKSHAYKRAIVVGDGVATAGDTDPSSLAARAAHLKAVGIERLDAIVMGGIRDESALKKLTIAGLLRDGVVVDGGLDPAAVERKLTLATRSGIPVAIEGARWQWPTTLDGVQAGDEVLVYAEVPEGQPVRLAVAGTSRAPLDLTPVERPLLERAWAKAKITSLLDQQAVESKADLAQQVVALSTTYRVLTPYTSLLVLETEQDFARFRVNRKALANVLTVERGKLAYLKRLPPGASGVDNGEVRVATAEQSRPVLRPRGAPAAPPPARTAQAPRPTAVPAPAPPRAVAAARPFAPDPMGDPLSARGSMWGSDAGDSFGAGGLGLSGIGESGSSHGEGIGIGGVGTLGHGAGSSGAASGRASGFGSGHGRLGGAHQARAPMVRAGETQVSGRLPPEVIQRVVRQSYGRFRACYEEGLRDNPRIAGRVALRFTIGRDGFVATSSADQSELPSSVAACIARAMYGLSFPAPEGGMITVVYPVMFSPDDGSAPESAPRPAAPSEPVMPPSKNAKAEPYTGRFKSVMDLIGAGGVKAAIDSAFAWHREAPGDVMALVALGEALEHARERVTAARVYGSIVDLFPARADLRRFAGERLERLGDAGMAAALDTFAKAEQDRPDHPESHRLVAFARLRHGDYEGAFAAAERGANQSYPQDRFRGVTQILREDLGLIAAAWIKADPAHRDAIIRRLSDARGMQEDSPSLRFVLSWETDANDVDFHIYDAEGGHAFYQQPELESGGRLYADVTTGYGPECFTIRLPRDKRSESYKLAAHYYSRGPMGYGMGKVEIIDHDGNGGLKFEERPFVVMADGAYVDLGTWQR